jgi:hypothetical protein
MNHFDLKTAALWVIGMLLFVVGGSFFVLLFGGCATTESAFGACTRIDAGAYDIMVCPPSLVDAHCWHTIKRWERKNGKAAPMDDGSVRPAGSLIRGCTDFKRPEKPTVFTSKKYRGCARHEAAHALKWGTPKEVGEKFPCLEEVE